jgi:hypothetical protein
LRDFTLKADKVKRFRVRINCPGFASEARYVQPLADDDGQTSEPPGGDQRDSRGVRLAAA